MSACILQEDMVCRPHGCFTKCRKNKRPNKTQNSFLAGEALYILRSDTDLETELWSKEKKDMAENVSTSGPLRRMMGKGEITPKARKGGSNYHKRAIPFDLDNPDHVEGLTALCVLFADPWTTGRDYSREDLAKDVGDFAQAILNGLIVPVSGEVYEAVVAPYLKEMAAKAAEAPAETQEVEAEPDAETDTSAEMPNFSKMTKKQLVAYGTDNYGLSFGSKVSRANAEKEVIGAWETANTNEGEG